MATEAITCFFYRKYDCAEHSSSGDYQLVRGAGRNVNDVSVDKILRPLIPNAASVVQQSLSVLAFTTVSQVNRVAFPSVTTKMSS